MRFVPICKRFACSDRYPTLISIFTTLIPGNHPRLRRPGVRVSEENLFPTWNNPQGGRWGEIPGLEIRDWKARQVGEEGK
jgi:hypothetical protein